MWKKQENEPMIQQRPASNNEPAPASRPQERATIGHSISIKGELSGAEDLMVHGFVDGTIDLKQNVVTVGKTGRVTAHIFARIIHIEGEVNGDLIGTEQVIVHMTGQVKGNITAPRVSLEDGAKVKGIIDTGPSIPETSLSAGKDREKAAALEPNQDLQKSAKKGNQSAHDNMSSTAAVQ